MRAFGCDVGNGFAYVSILDSTGRPQCALPAHWAMGSGMPAEAYVNTDGSIDVASQGAVTHTDPGRIVRAVKRSLEQGTVYLNPTDGTGSLAVDAAAVYSAIARRALEASAEALAARGDTPPHDVVLTYPAAFADSRRLIATMRDAICCLTAADGSRYDVVGSIPEPAAIALDYLHFMRHEVAATKRLTQRDLTVVVYDLGHGTFDTALVTARAVLPGNEERPWDLHDYDGLSDVGGIDFDDALIELFKQRFQAPTATGTPDAYLHDMLRAQAVRCKHELTEAESCEVRLLLSDGSAARFIVTRDEFEEATHHLIDQTLEKVSVMLESARRLGMPATHVVLSGGASRMPMVRRKVQELVGDDVTVTLYRPSEAVSFGAARYARTLVRTVPKTMPIDDAATVEQRMDRLFEPVIANRPVEPEVTPAADLVQHVPHPLGVLYPSRRGRAMQVILPRGAVASERSALGQLRLRADDMHVELVIARATDPHTTKRHLQEGAFREVCHLVCERATIGAVYDVQIWLRDDGMLSGCLVDETGHTLPMEMS